MVDVLNENGLTVSTLPELIDSLTTALEGVYGNDINVNSNTSDGQTININSQVAVDLRELLVAINSGFDPDQAVGVILDQRVALNNIQRNGGTFTIQPVEITVDRTVTLQGLDAAFSSINGTGYTVQDNSGNQFILIDTTVLTTGTTELNFRSKVLGQIETIVGTINNPVTVVLGVTGVNNPNAALSIGQNEETDPELRLRRQKSVALGSNGYLNGLLGRLLQLSGVTDARLIENVTNSTDANGIPAHGIWAIVNGGANSDIANAIYTRKSYGANMKGAVQIPIITASGLTFTAKFDRPSPQNLYIRFNIQTTITGASFDQTALKQYLVDNLDYKIGEYAQTANITAIAYAGIAAQGGGGFPAEVEISGDGVTWVDYLATSALDKEFVPDSSRITITVIP